MVFGWRKKKNNLLQDLVKPTPEIVIPTHFLCPITLELMKDPVTLSTGITYDRESIERWFYESHSTCPVTNQTLRSTDLIPNHTLRIMIQHWCVQYGVERIPTPKTPISPHQVSHLLLSLKSSSSHLDHHTSLDWLHKLEKWGHESERNRKCIVENGGGLALASAFEAFARVSNYPNIENMNSKLLEDILSSLNWMFPLVKEARKCMTSQASSYCMVWFLKHQNEKAIIFLNELISSFGDKCKHDEHGQLVEVLVEVEGVGDVLVDLINKRISPTMTKASLSILFYLVDSFSKNIKLRFVELGMVSSMLDIALDLDNSVSEKALSVLDSLCSTEEGREKGYNNALMIPVLSKKLLRVSAMATDCSVSTMWKLCKNGGDNEKGKMVVEALQMGAFQKLLLVLQLGLKTETKMKATQLLKLLNPYREGLECIDSDFKNLKRPY